MSRRSFFHHIEDAFQSLGGEESQFSENGLPESISLRGDWVFYENSCTLREDSYVSVREDGPDAWGYQIEVPAGAFYRRDNWDQWRWAMHKEYLWVTMAGSMVDVISFDGLLADWTRYIAKEE